MGSWTGHIGRRSPLVADPAVVFPSCLPQGSSLESILSDSNPPSGSTQAAYSSRTTDPAGCVKQHYEPRALPETLKVLDVTSLGAPEGSPVFTSKLHGILTQWQSHFNLSQGPLYEVTYLHGFSDGSSRIWFALHHLIVDAVSWRLITE